MNQELTVFDLQAQLCQSLGNALRLQIIHTLKEEPKSVNGLALTLGIPQSSASRHLARLRSVGILNSQRKGAEIFYEIANPKIVAVCEMMRTILAERDAHRVEILSLIQELPTATFL